MLTADSGRLGLGPGDRVLDLGCGSGRHAADALRRGATVVALDLDAAGAAEAATTVAGMDDPHPAGSAAVAVGDALALPFPDATFDVVVAAEVLEHLGDDAGAASELNRVLRPGGRAAVTVPRWFPERVCWALSSGYHAPAVPGGHVRIYRRRALVALLGHAGLEVVGAHHVHALHAPYWWLRCAVGLDRPQALPVRLYHRLLVWEIMRRPRSLRLLEQLLAPVLGKSLVLYLRRRPDPAPAGAAKTVGTGVAA